MFVAQHAMFVAQHVMFVAQHVMFAYITGSPVEDHTPASHGEVALLS